MWLEFQHLRPTVIVMWIPAPKLRVLVWVSLGQWAWLGHAFWRALLPLMMWEILMPCTCTFCHWERGCMWQCPLFKRGILMWLFSLLLRSGSRTAELSRGSKSGHCSSHWPIYRLPPSLVLCPSPLLAPTPTQHHLHWWPAFLTLTIMPFPLSPLQVVLLLDPTSLKIGIPPCTQTLLVICPVPHLHPCFPSTLSHQSPGTKVK